MTYAWNTGPYSQERIEEINMGIEDLESEYQDQEKQEQEETNENKK